MQIGCRINSLSPRVADALELASRAGFSCVELDWHAVKRQQLGRGGGIGILKSLLKDNGLTAAAVYVGAVSAEREDQEKLQAFEIEENFSMIQEAGCGLCIVRAGSRTVENFNMVVEALSEIADVGQKLGIKVAVANCIDTRIEDRRDMLALFLGSMLQKVGLCMDLYHLHMAVVNPSDLTIEHGHRISAVRVSDALGGTPMPLGQGELRLGGLIRALKGVDFDGPLLVDNFTAVAPDFLPLQMKEAREYLQCLLD